MSYKMKRGVKPKFKELGSSPTKVAPIVAMAGKALAGKVAGKVADKAMDDGPLKKEDDRSFSEKLRDGDITVDGKTYDEIRKENLEKERQKWIVKGKLDQEKHKHQEKIKKQKKMNISTYGQYGKIKPIVDQTERNIGKIKRRLLK